MDTHEDFRRSERQTLPARGAIVALALAFGWADGASVPGVLALGAGFALYTAILQLWLLDRFQSDAWIYGMAGADSLFAGAAALALGLPGPSAALPALFAVQHALFLGYRGAAAAAVAGALAATAGAVVGGSGAVSSMAAVVPGSFAAAALSGYIAEQRFAERARRRRLQAARDTDVDAGIVLDGLRPIGRAGTESEALEQLARGLLTVSGFETVAVYTRATGLGMRLSVSLSRFGGHQHPQPGDEPIHGRTALARAVSQGVALGIGAGGVPADRLPDWAARSGYDSGVVAPMIVDGVTIGVAFCLQRGKAPATIERIDRVERFVAFGARLLAAHLQGDRPVRKDRLSLELDAAGRAAPGDVRPAIEMERLMLEPATDRSFIDGVPVSLSRTEFDLLYALARAGQVVGTDSLFEAAFGASPDGGQRTLDAAIYRLRRKLARVPAGEGLVQTVRGKGYVLVPPVAVEERSDADPVGAG